MDNIFRFQHAYVFSAEQTSGFSSRNGGTLCFCLIGTENFLFALKLRYRLCTVSAFFVMLTPILIATFIAASQHFSQVQPFIYSRARFNGKVSIRLICLMLCLVWFDSISWSNSSPPSTMDRYPSSPSWAMLNTAISALIDWWVSSFLLAANRIWASGDSK